MSVETDAVNKKPTTSTHYLFHVVEDDDEYEIPGVNLTARDVGAEWAGGIERV